MKTASVFIWVAMVLAAFCLARNGHGAKTPSLVAVRALPQNTLLLPGSLTPDAFAMHYVRPDAGLAAGATVTAADLAPQPVLPSVPADHVLATAPVTWTAVQNGLNAGAAIQICQDKAMLGAATVLAVRCDTGKTDRSCTGIVSIPLASDSLLRAWAKPDGIRLAASC